MRAGAVEHFPVVHLNVVVMDEPRPVIAVHHFSGCRHVVSCLTLASLLNSVGLFEDDAVIKGRLEFRSGRRQRDKGSYIALASQTGNIKRKLVSRN